MKNHYDKNQNFYNRSDAVKVAFVSIPFGADKNKTKEVADIMHKDALASVKNANTKEFSRIAMRHTDKLAKLSKISVETNETDYLEKAAFEAKFGTGIFDSMKDNNPGEIKPLITTADAFVIMMKTGFRKEINEKFEDAKPKIVKRLAYEGRNDFYKKFTDDLRAEFKITVNKPLLAELSKDDKPKLANVTGGMNQGQMPPAAKPPVQNTITTTKTTAQQIDKAQPKDANADN